MSRIHVEDDPAKPGTFTSAPNRFNQRHHSSTTKGLSTWRCWTCKALAVGPLGEKPTSPCGKCKAKP